MKILPVFAAGSSSFNVSRQFAAMSGEFGHNLLVQPDIHGRRVIGVAGVIQLFRKLFSRGQAAVEFQGFQQINDGRSPGQLFACGGCSLVNNRRNVDGLCRRGARRRQCW